MPSDLVAMLEMELAQTLSLLCIGAAVTQLLPTISRVVRLGSVGSLPFIPHLVEACCRTWFCLYLWIVVRSRRPLAHAPAQGWLAGHDWVDLFLYGDTILGNVVVWLMLGLFVVYDGGWGLPAFAALAGLPLAAYTLDSLALSQATLELGMVIKDCVILGSAGMEVAVRVAAADSGSISATDGWRHAMGATSAGLRIVTTLSLGSFVGSATLLRGWAVVFLSEGGKLAVMGLYPAKGEEGGVMRSLSRSLSAGGMADKQL